jgi:pyruvate/2-oxoacid:ferredoxin oxidoreductase beta subunit
MNPIPIFITYDVSFVARTTSADMAGMGEIIKSAITHPGMSIVTILSPCYTFPVLTFSDVRKITKPLPVDHPQDDKMAALEKAYQVDPVYTGIFYRVKRPTLTQNLQGEIEQVSRPDGEGKWDSVKALIKTYS